MKKTATKSSCSTGFDSPGTAAKNAAYFTVNASYESGFTILVSGVSEAEWKLYRQIIELLRQRKINITTSRW